MHSGLTILYEMYEHRVNEKRTPGIFMLVGHHGKKACLEPMGRSTVSIGSHVLG